MMSRVLVTLLALASMAANAPGWNLAGQLQPSATMNPDLGFHGTVSATEPGADLYIDQWLGRIDDAMAAWSPLDVGALDFPTEVLHRADHWSSADPSPRFASASFDNPSLESPFFESPEQIARQIRLAALDPAMSSRFAGAAGQVRGTFDSLSGTGGGFIGGSGSGGGHGSNAGGNGNDNDNGNGNGNGGDSAVGSGPDAGHDNHVPDNVPGLVPTEPGVTPPVSVPEPASLGLLGLGLIGLRLAGRRRAKIQGA